MPIIIQATRNNDTWVIEDNGLLYICDEKDFLKWLWYLIIKAYLQ
jgi:hypothetical protein